MPDYPNSTQQQGSSRRPRVVILGVGNELTEGRTQDVHARYLGATLRELEMEVRRVSLIPDDYALYVEELRRGAAEADVVISTGGLGPTTDDLTREVMAEVAGQPLEFHEELWDELRARFPRRRISETNKKQVMIPRGFRIFDNPHGTAPGFAGRAGEAWLLALPGPPKELLPMVETHVRPLLGEAFSVVPDEVLRATAIMVPESELEEALQKAAEPGMDWGTRTELYRISFSIRGGDAAAREGVLRALREDLGEARIHPGETDAARLLLEALRQRDYRLVTAESCTGGLISALLTDIPGSSAGLWGGVVAYSDEVKEQMLGVPEALIREYGAVSEEVALAMAEGALARAGGSAQIAVSVTGIAGPDGGTPEKPVGTVWIAVALAGGPSRTEQLSIPASRDRVRRWSAVSAMLLAIQVIGSPDASA